VIVVINNNKTKGEAATPLPNAYKISPTGDGSQNHAKLNA